MDVSLENKLASAFLRAPPLMGDFHYEGDGQSAFAFLPSPFHRFYPVALLTMKKPLTRRATARFVSGIILYLGLISGILSGFEL